MDSRAVTEHFRRYQRACNQVDHGATANSSAVCDGGKIAGRVENLIRSADYGVT